MQVLTAAERAMTRGDRIALIRGAIAAVLMCVTGAMLGWVVVGTPFLSSVQPGLRATTPQVVVAIAAWGLAILLPAGFLVLGVARAVQALEILSALRPHASLPKLARELGEDHLVATGIRLPDGRWIPELVLGPFGLAVIAPAPPRGGTRRVGNRWELRGARGSWTPIESPLERTSRDADRVRRWLAGQDRDFIPKVYAALITSDPTVERTPTCATVAPHDLAAWVRSLPPQRGLTPARRDHLVDAVTEVAGH